MPCSTRAPLQNIRYLRNKADAYNTSHPDYGFLHDPISLPIPGEYFGFLTRAPNPLP